MKIIPILCCLILSSPTVFSQSTVDMKQEASRTFEVSDKAMNDAYRKLMGILNEVGKKRLIEAQRAWIAYRDAQAGFDSHHFDGGTLEGLEQIGAMNMLTQERTKRLLGDFERFESIY